MVFSAGDNDEKADSEPAVRASLVLEQTSHLRHLSAGHNWETSGTNEVWFGPQRDLNPCLSLERTEEDEEDQ